MFEANDVAFLLHNDSASVIGPDALPKYIVSAFLLFSVTPALPMYVHHELEALVFLL
jgi:hypothetical protein